MRTGFAVNKEGFKIEDLIFGFQTLLNRFGVNGALELQEDDNRLGFIFDTNKETDIKDQAYVLPE